MKRRKEVSKKNLIIEEIFYIFMFLYGCLFLMAFTLSAFKNGLIFGIFVGLLSGLCAGIFLYFVIYRLVLLCYQDVIYEDELDFFGKLFGVKRRDKSDSVPVEGVVSEDKFNKLDKDNDGKIMVNEVYPLTEDEVEKKIIKHDEDFSNTLFNSFVSNVYKVYEESLNKQDSLLTRSFMSDTLYFQHRLHINELSNMKNKEKRTYVKIKGILLKDFKIEGDNEVLTVALTSKMKKYSINSDGEVVSGSKDEYIDCPYIMTFVRKVGVKTKGDFSIENCPNCGAVVKINDDGVCDYCSTYVVSGEFGWVLTDIKEIDIL